MRGWACFLMHNAKCKMQNAQSRTAGQKSKRFCWVTTAHLRCLASPVAFLSPGLVASAKLPRPGLCHNLACEASRMGLVKLGNWSIVEESLRFSNAINLLSLSPRRPELTAPRPTRLSVKSSPCRRYGPRASALGTNRLAARAEAVVPYGGKPPAQGQI